MAGEHTYGGRYEVIERAGVGGMAEVYRARDELLGREVAVKVLSDKFSRDHSFVERFRREAQSAANLNHPNIASIYDYGDDGGTYFIVMEYIDGKPLSDIIEAEAPLMPERAAEVASDVARALERAHASGLVHRDIKPGNIMMESNGQTKVTDFGIARALTADGEATMTQTGMVIGTASYLSPEQAQGNPVDPRSDVYALGCVLYEMLTGSAPFTGDSPLSIAYEHVRENPEPPSHLHPDVSQELDAIVLKAMAKNPDNRFSSAAEMREDLARFLAGQKVQATPILADTTMFAAPGGGTQVLRQSDMYDDEPPPDDSKKRTGWYLLLTLLVLALLGLLAYFLATNLLGGGVEVPDVVGQQVEDARATVEDAGFDTAVRRRADPDVPAGEVFEQDPGGGEEADEGATVTLFVSTGPAETRVPDVVGISEVDARQELRAADLRVGRVTKEASTEVADGLVISSDPSEGTTVDEDSEVDLVISSGAATVTVPDVIGSSEDEAIAALDAEGLAADSITAPSDEAEGTVIAQEPAGGSEAAEGDTVTITVSSGPEEQAMPDVTGEDADDAETALEDNLGLDVTQEETDEPCAQPPGTVCSQDPEEGTPVSEGDSATLFVNPGG
ncbi:MAG: Stk1 family PASTA domain-containing Ser/Thr kinase [Actinomycetota bacterium]